MSDVIHCTVVLHRDGYEHLGEERSDGLAFVLPRPNGKKDWHWIACREKSRPKPNDRSQPVWQYEVRGDRLHFTPSLLDRITGFHTANDWDVAFREKPDGIGAHDFFFQVNPDVTP